MSAEKRFNGIWYGGERPPLWTRPLAALFRGVVALRRGLFRLGLLRRTRVPVPVIVIGNITAGGTGKTPLALYLLERFQELGINAGVVSRGYGGKPGPEPLPVTATTPTALAGDEPVLIARRSGAPVVVHPRRARAAAALLARHSVDLIICDDGLQHYALARDVEVAVIDGVRGLGNRRMLPAGPLREPASRLDRVDYAVRNGGRPVPGGGTFNMQIEPVALVNLATGERLAPAALAGQACAAVAGTGHPQRFFTTLGELGYRAECRAFPDHHAFTPADFEFAGNRPVLMTEKDAVKCLSFASANWWYLEIAAALDGDLAARIVEHLGLAHESGRARRGSNV